MTIKRWRCMTCEIDFTEEWNCKCGDDGAVVEVYICPVAEARHFPDAGSGIDVELFGGDMIIKEAT